MLIVEILIIIAFVVAYWSFVNAVSYVNIKINILWSLLAEQAYLRQADDARAHKKTRQYLKKMVLDFQGNLPVDANKSIRWAWKHLPIELSDFDRMMFICDDHWRQQLKQKRYLNDNQVALFEGRISDIKSEE